MLLLTLIAFDFFMRSMTRACNVVHYSSHAWWLIVAKVREWATVYLLRITSFSTVRQYCIMCGHGNVAWYSYVHIHEYSARHHKLPKHSPKRQRVTENGRSKSYTILREILCRVRFSLQNSRTVYLARDMAVETMYGEFGQWDRTILVTWIDHNANCMRQLV